jgi:hypothetical protein
MELRCCGMPFAKRWDTVKPKQYGCKQVAQAKAAGEESLVGQEGQALFCLSVAVERAKT